MNTEKINAYRQVVDVLKDVNSLRTYSNAGTPERVDLDNIAIALEEMSWQIISDDISTALDSLTIKLIEIRKLNTKIKESYTHLKSISEKILKVADVIGVLIEISSKAISAGLI